MPTSPLDYIPQLKTGKEAGGLPPRLLKKTATSLEGALRGELPEDVQNLLRQQAAEYGVASGAPGSQFQSYAGLRNLGLTSLDRIQGAERLLAPNFISPVQAQQLSLDAGKIRAGIALNQAELAQQKELEQAKLAQGQTQFSRKQDLEREELAQRAALAAASESGANYRASLGLGSGGGGGRSGGGLRLGYGGSGTGSGAGFDPEGIYSQPSIGARGTGPEGGISYDLPSSTGFDWSGYYGTTGLSPGGGTSYGASGVPTYDTGYSDEFLGDYYDYAY